MSGVPQPSPVQQATSPIAGRWQGLKGWHKLGIGAAATAGLVALVVMPGLGGIGGQDKPQRKAEADKVQPFDAGITPAAAHAMATKEPPLGGQAPRFHRVPPPLDIDAYSAPVAPPSAPARAATAADGLADPAASEGAQAGLGAQGHPDSLAGQLSGPVLLHGSRAAIMRHPDYVITAGAHIPCLPVEATNSALGGFISCRVPEWVRGTTERRGLLPPGTLIFGQIRAGMQHGQRRLGEVFTRIETAGDHFTIPIAAPVADEMGRAGVDGDLRTFFWDQVGAVALYALLDSVERGAQAGANAAVSGAVGGEGGNFIQFGGGQSLAGLALRDRLNRPPELTRDQALPVEVSIGQDLDFYDACHERMAFNAMACPLQ